MTYRLCRTKRITLYRCAIAQKMKETSGQIDFSGRAARGPMGCLAQGRNTMSGQVVLYFEDQADALRFALAAGSVMAGDGAKFSSDLVEKTGRVTRIRLDAVSAGNSKKPNPMRAA
jgi:hypothetical protein